MKTVRVKVKEQIYDQFLKALNHFDKEEVEILKNSFDSQDLYNYQEESTESGGSASKERRVNQNTFGELEESDNLREVRNLIKQLSSIELVRARQWFSEIDHNLWDAKIEQDSKSGKLDSLVQEALEEYQSKEVNDL